MTTLIAQKAGENRFKVLIGNYEPGRGMSLTLGAGNQEAAKAQFVRLILAEWAEYCSRGVSVDDYAEMLDLTQDDMQDLIGGLWK